VGQTELDEARWPIRLVSSWRRPSSTGTSSTAPYWPYPALLIKTSIRPRSRIIWSTAATIEASLVTSSAITPQPAEARSAMRSIRRAAA
jgi:hypothetical protein